MNEDESILCLLGEIKQKHPELRVCQILSNAALMAGWRIDDLFYCPDATILKGINSYMEIM